MLPLPLRPVPVWLLPLMLGLFVDDPPLLLALLSDELLPLFVLLSVDDPDLFVDFDELSLPVLELLLLLLLSLVVFELLDVLLLSVLDSDLPLVDELELFVLVPLVELPSVLLVLFVFEDVEPLVPLLEAPLLLLAGLL